MIILLTSPEEYPGEAQIISRMMETHPALLVHLRKPESTVSELEQLIGQIPAGFHSRLVIHQHYTLPDKFRLKGIHLPEKERVPGVIHQHVISTSFHRLADAIDQEQEFEYFFCSPVFKSISKPGYVVDEEWDIKSTSIIFKEKAIALGGIDDSVHQQVLNKGFKHVAVLGSVWGSSDPQAALNRIFNCYSG